MQQLQQLPLYIAATLLFALTSCSPPTDFTDLQAEIRMDTFANFGARSGVTEADFEVSVESVGTGPLGLTLLDAPASVLAPKSLWLPAGEAGSLAIVWSVPSEAGAWEATMTYLTNAENIPEDLEGRRIITFTLQGESIGVCEETCVEDDNPCTVSSCKEDGSCGVVNLDDGSACGNDQVCSKGACVCDDYNDCTVDTLDASGTCVYTDATDGVICGDLQCADVYACSVGQCVVRDPDSVCDADAMDPLDGGQAYIDQFAGCSVILGEVVVKRIFSGAETNNIDALSSVRAMESLEIVGTYNQKNPVQDLRALSNLECASNLEIRGVRDLQTLDGLNALKSVKWIAINGNPKVTSLAGLSSLETAYQISLVKNGFSDFSTLGPVANVEALILGGLQMSSFVGLEWAQDLRSLTISGTQLTSLIGAPSLRAKGNVFLQSNWQLTSLDGLRLQRGELNRLDISRSGLVNLSGLERLTKIRTLYIVDNRELVSLAGAENAIIRELRVVSNPKLPNLKPLPPQADLQFLTLDRNPSMTSVGLTARIQFLTIYGNHALTDISGLAMRSLSRIFYLQDNPLLRSLEGFKAPISIADLRILYNLSLTSLVGLENVRTAGRLEIRDNLELPNLQGLSNLRRATTIEISGNESLTSLSGLDSLQAIVGHKGMTSTAMGGKENLSLMLNDSPALTDISTLHWISILGQVYVSETGIAQCEIDALNLPLPCVCTDNDEVATCQ